MRLDRESLRKRFNKALNHARENILKKDPNVLGIIVNGSVARGDQGPYSDIDIIALTKPKSKLKKFFYFDDNIQVDIWFMAIDKYSTPKGLDVQYDRSAKSNLILFDKNGNVKRILDKIRTVHASSEDIQGMLEHSCRNLLEYAGKVRNGKIANDTRLIRYAAYMIAEASQNPIIIANNMRIVSENILWDQLSAAKKKPIHFAIDYPICFALVGTTDTAKVYTSSLRLASESLMFIEKELKKNIKAQNIKSMLTYKSKSDILD